MENIGCEKKDRCETFLEKVKAKIGLEREKLQTAAVSGRESLDRFSGNNPKCEPKEKKDSPTSLEGDISREFDHLSEFVNEVLIIINEFSKIV